MHRSAEGNEPQRAFKKKRKNLGGRRVGLEKRQEERDKEALEGGIFIDSAKNRKKVQKTRRTANWYKFKNFGKTMLRKIGAYASGWGKKVQAAKRGRTESSPMGKRGDLAKVRASQGGEEV